MADDLTQVQHETLQSMQAALDASQIEADSFRELAATLADRLAKQTKHNRFLITLLIGGLVAGVVWFGTAW